MLLVANYHYVGMPAYPHPGIHGLSVEQFRCHLAYLRRHFIPIGLDDLRAMVATGQDWSAARYCLITLDDGLRCHYEQVVPLLAEAAMPAAFFVCAKPLVENQAVDIHKSQFVRAHVPATEVYSRALKVAAASGWDARPGSLFTDQDARRHYRYDDLEAARLKYLMNYVLPEELNARIIDELFKSLVDDEAAFCRQWYLTAEEIRAMHDQYRCIGSHAWSHRPLAILAPARIEEELQRSKATIEAIVGGEVSAISYPLGGERAVNLEVGHTAARVGYEIGFTMEREINQTPQEPLMFARIDGNDLPEVGKQAAFALEGNELTHSGDRRIARRRLYLEE